MSLAQQMAAVMPYFVKGIIAQFLLMGFGYTLARDYWRAVYFVAAALLNVAILFMEKR